MYQLKQQSLTLIDRLCAALDAEGVSYCQWKGHRKQSRWAGGEGDIDLLVDRADVELFRSIVCGLGFKQALPPPERQIPGVAHYYGLDADAHRFIHVHVHYQLVFGHHSTVNYHLPLERPLLESAIPGKVFRTPAPEFELIVFVIGKVISYSLWASAFRKQSAWSTTTQEELEYLQSKASPTKTNDILEFHLPYLGATFFNACMQALGRAPSHWARLKMRGQMHRKLEAHVRRPPFFEFLWRLTCWGMTRVRRRVRGWASRSRLTSGGKMIAIVGGDGAGKSTAVAGLCDWLSPRFSTTKVHLGKPPKSGLTLGVAVARRATLLFGKWFGRRRTGPPADWGGPGLSGYLLLLRSLCIARDRYRLYVKARRLATNGELVFCDRYPISQIKFMDGPNIGRLVGSAQANRITDFLRRAEASYYQHIMDPDLLIVLRVRPEIAVQRKTDEDSDYVRSRSLEVWGLDFSGTRAHVVDAGRSGPEVLADLRSLVWSGL